MSTLSPAVHRAIVYVDVEGFGDRRRTHPHQIAMRSGLYRSLRTAFTRSGVRWKDCYHEDRGDGVLVLVPPEIPKKILVSGVPCELAAALGEHNRTHGPEALIRLRLAIHAGEIHHDDHGVAGTAINFASRLLEAGALKRALGDSSGVLAVIASQWFFEEVIRHHPASAPASYRRVRISVKETEAIAWICLPDDPYPPDERAELPSAPMSGLAVASAAMHTLPRDIASFTGRQAELERLMRALSGAAASGGVVGINAIDGMAGVGKTTFAVHAAHQLAPRFPDGQLFLCLHAHTPGQRPVNPADALGTLLLTMGIAAQQIPPGLEARTGLWRDRMAGKKMLVLLDDAAGSDQIRPLLPSTADSLVLITSRRRLTALDETVPISLDTLPPAEAAELFVRLAGRPDLDQADSAVAKVVRLCGYLPLAIRLIGGQLNHHVTWTVTDIANDLAESHDRLATMHAENDSVTAAFNLSYQDLTSDQQRLFRRLGLHQGTDIDAYAAADLNGTTLTVARQYLEDLYDHHLIDEPTRSRYRFHDLIREHARSLASTDDPAERDAAIASLTQALELCRELGNRLGQAYALNRLGAVQTMAGDYPAATATLAQALALCRKLGDRLGEANAYNTMGELLFASSAAAEACAHHKQALGIARDIGASMEEARALEGIGRCRLKDVRPEDGTTHLRHARTHYLPPHRIPA